MLCVKDVSPFDGPVCQQGIAIRLSLRHFPRSPKGATDANPRCPYLDAGTPISPFTRFSVHESRVTDDPMLACTKILSYAFTTPRQRQSELVTASAFPHFFAESV